MQGLQNENIDLKKQVKRLELCNALSQRKKSLWAKQKDEMNEEIVKLRAELTGFCENDKVIRAEKEVLSAQLNEQSKTLKHLQAKFQRLRKIRIDLQSLEMEADTPVQQDETNASPQHDDEANISPPNDDNEANASPPNDEKEDDPLLTLNKPLSSFRLSGTHESKTNTSLSQKPAENMFGTPAMMYSQAATSKENPPDRTWMEGYKEAKNRGQFLLEHKAKLKAQSAKGKSPQEPQRPQEEPPKEIQSRERSASPERYRHPFRANIDVDTAENLAMNSRKRERSLESEETYGSNKRLQR